jgi:hypothetical protein
MKRPSAVPWNTKLPAAVSVPPFHGATYSARQASFCLTGSHAASRPNARAFGGVGGAAELAGWGCVLQAARLAVVLGKKRQAESTRGERIIRIPPNDL